MVSPPSPLLLQVPLHVPSHLGLHALCLTLEHKLDSQGQYFNIK